MFTETRILACMKDCYCRLFTPKVKGKVWYLDNIEVRDNGSSLYKVKVTKRIVEFLSWMRKIS